MQGLETFIIKPFGGEYRHEKNGVLISSSIEDAAFTNRIGYVLDIPLKYDGDIESGDLVIVGHNVFRTYYGTQGEKRRSSNYFKDGKYLVYSDEIYMYKKQSSVGWKSESEYCAVNPIENDSNWSSDRYKEVVGILKIPNKELIKQGLKYGDTVVFKEGSEYEFNINGHKWFLMRSRNVFVLENEGVK